MRDHAKAGIAGMLKLCPELLHLSMQNLPVTDPKKGEEAADSRYKHILNSIQFNSSCISLLLKHDGKFENPDEVFTRPQKKTPLECQNKGCCFTVVMSASAFWMGVLRAR